MNQANRFSTLTRNLGIAMLAACAALLIHAFVTATADGNVSSFCSDGMTDQLVQEAAPGKIALVTNRNQLTPGDLLAARVVNRGEEKVGYGREFVIQRYFEGQWMRDPASPDGPWPKVLKIVDRGSAGQCYRFAIPADQPSGRYRITTHVRVRSPSPRLVRRASEFVVQYRL